MLMMNSDANAQLFSANLTELLAEVSKCNNNETASQLTGKTVR